MKHKLFLASPMLAMMLAVGMAEVAHATLFQYEGFDYANPATQISARSGGGTGWSGSSWSQSGSTTFTTTGTTGSLSYGGPTNFLTTSGGTITDATASGNAGGIIRSRQASNTNSSTNFTRWFSLLVKVDSLPNNLGTGFSASVAPDYKSAGQIGTGFGAVWDSSSSSYKFKLFIDSGVQNNNVTTAGNVTMLSGQTMLLVGKFFNNAGGQDGLEMWLNPTIASLGGADLSGLSGALGYLTHTNFFGSGGQLGDARFSITDVPGFQGSFDEIRIGDTYASVTPFTVAVPEPSAFLAVGLVGLVSWSLNGGRRRRRRQDG